MARFRILLVMAALLVPLTPGGMLPVSHAEDASPLTFPETPKIEQHRSARYIGLPRHDYGVVAQRAELNATIPYLNSGSQTLRGIRVKSGCSCFGATLSHRTLAPGERGTLTVRFRSGSMKGDVEKPLQLLCLAGETKHVAQLRLRAQVRAGILVERVWFGEVRAGSKPTASAPLAWFEGVGTPFEVTKIEVPGPAMETRIEPYKVGDGTTYRGWTLHFTFKEPPPKGIYSRKALVHTTHPKQPTVEVPLSGNVVGSVWVQTSRIHLGFVPQGTARSASVKIKASGKDAPPLKRVEARSRGGVLTVAVTDGFDPFVGPHKLVTVTVPAGAKAGALDDVLEIRTDLAGDEVTEVEVLGRVYTPQGPK